MRRIDVILISLGLFLSGGLIYGLLKILGVEGFNAGIWTQLVLVLGIILWTSTYFFRVFTQKMTLNQQLEDYKLAVLQKRYDSLSPEEKAALDAEVAAERQNREALGKTENPAD